MRAIAAAVGVISGALLASSCGGSTTPQTTSAGISLESPRVQQIALARASNRLFSMFPGRPGTRTCGIPEGGVHFKPAVLPGTCMTSIHREDSHEPALIVTFTEQWAWPTCPRGAYCPASSRLVRHTWQVVEGEPIVTSTSRLRVLATREHGATAPQYYK